MKFKLGNIKKIVSVSIFIDGDSYRYDALTLKLVKGEIDIVEEYYNLKEFKDLFSKIGNDNPFIINFNGKGVLNRRVENSEGKHKTVLLNNNTNEFYFTDYIEDSIAYISVIRRNIVQDFVKLIGNYKGNVIGISSGPFIVSRIAEFISKENYQCFGYRLDFQKDTLTNYIKENDFSVQNYEIGKKQINSFAITALSAGVHFFNPSPKIHLPNEQNIFETNFEEARQKVIFKQFGFFLLAFFLTILFGNYLFVNHLNKKLQTNAFILAEYGEEFSYITKLEEEKTRKEILLRTSGVLSKKYISFYLIEIANSVPKEITFSQLTIKPVKKEIKAKHKIEIDNQLILVNGISKSSRYLSDWIADLKTLEWINKVEIIDYEYADGIGEFTIKIVI